MKITCPHCGEPHEINIGKLAASNVTDARRRAARENGKKGGRPRTAKPKEEKPKTKKQRRGRRRRAEKLKPGEPDPRD